LATPIAVAAGALILGKLFGGSSAPAPSPSAPPPSIPTNVPPGKILGGRGDLIGKLTAGGAGPQVNSWVGPGENNPIEPGQLGSALGENTLNELAQRTGMSQQELLKQLAVVLPQLINYLTPNGRVPTVAPGGLGETFEAREAPSQPERRWINAEVEGHRRGEALAKGIKYTLAFDVDVKQRLDAVGGVALLDSSQIFVPDVKEATLTVQLDSTDFAIDKRTDSLLLPRVGKSTEKASFEITPLHEGASKIKATIHVEGNFIQQLEMIFDVGAPRESKVEVTAVGRPPSAVAVVQPRDVGLSISPTVGGYDCTVWGAVMARAHLAILPADLAKAVDVARAELMKVVMQRSEGKYVFQSGIDIPAADRDLALRTLARAGATLFRRLFFGPAAAADANKVGTFLRDMATGARKLKLQILAESAPIPWAMLYVGDASDNANLDWNNFLGMRHVIEIIPLQNTLVTSAADTPSDKPKLAVSVNVNRNIDAQMGVNLVARQETYWGDADKTGNVHVIPRVTKAELVKALASGTRTIKSSISFVTRSQPTCPTLEDRTPRVLCSPTIAYRSAISI
jgi:uncharacterized protein YidB (DUF937 family)